MPENSVLTHAQLKSPKAAAIAGIAFSLLLLSILWLLRTSIPADPLEPGAWLATDTRAITVALNLVPFGCRLHMVYRRAARSAPPRFGAPFLPAAFLGGLCFFCCGCCLRPPYTRR